MTHIPYQWRDDLYCEEDIVDALTRQNPWSEWLDDEDNQPGAEDAEEQLDDIADLLGIDREDSDERLIEQDFPVRLNSTPEPPSFCTDCLRFFS